ncbi:MAG TPA: ATP-binding protein [Tepidisphaeraceae bacterium]|jgi:PAS domain S-box-containing protein|nr:ATP-binding protein [Tepidisphaeraceae bacterium]
MASYNHSTSTEELQALLAAIVTSSDDAIVSKDLNGIVQSWNASAERIFGHTADEMIGQSILKIIPPERSGEETEILNRLRRGDRVDHFETVRIRKDGAPIDVSVTISPIKDAAGRVVGASKVARDITQFKRAMAERDRLLVTEKAARQSAEHANRMKDEFLATLSHELRTPLNAILGWAQLLKSGESTQADLTEAIDTIERNARLQNQLIEDLLDMSRIISGKMRLEMQPVDLPYVIQGALAAVRPAAEAKSIRLQQIIDPNVASVHGDPNRLQQVLWNLLSNSIKYTPRGGWVQIALREKNNTVEISVIDNGQGITPEFLPRLFTRFAQADQSSTRRHGGLGLGLAIVRHLTELHGGSVRANSGGLGKGSTFVVSLPARESAKLAPREEPILMSPPSQPLNVDLHGVKVLMVDDEEDARLLVARVLSPRGASVVVAGSVQEALEQIRDYRPDVILCDIGMPHEDGFALLKSVRALEAGSGRQTPVVAVTAFARAEDRRRMLLAGFHMHVAKPVEPAELIAVVANVARVAQTDDTAAVAQ